MGFDMNMKLLEEEVMNVRKGNNKCLLHFKVLVAEA